jgi:molybdopterin-guanine dinucleotide biosynthesis protein A
VSERTVQRSNDKIYPDLAVAVLAGGESRRFGADKALVRLVPDGPPLIARIVTKALELSPLVAVVGHERYSDLNLDVPIFQDEEIERGPLAGIATAMRRLDRPRVLILACDMPCLSVPLLRWMIERPTHGDVVIPRTSDGRWQPLHAIYQRSALPEIDRSLRTGNGAVRSILPGLVVDTLDESELRVIDPGLTSLFSLNRPEDLEVARSCIEGS